MTTLFHPKQSRYYLFYVLFTHCFAAGCLWLLGLLMVSLPFLLLSFFYYGNRKTTARTLIHHQKAQWVLEDSSALLLGSSIMLSHWLILRFQLNDDSGRKTVVLFSDCFSPAEWRALRRCVRMGYL